MWGAVIQLRSWESAEGLTRGDAVLPTGHDPPRTEIHVARFLVGLDQTRPPVMRGPGAGMQQRLTLRSETSIARKLFGFRAGLMAHKGRIPNERALGRAKGGPSDHRVGDGRSSAACTVVTGQERASPLLSKMRRRDKSRVPSREGRVQLEAAVGLRFR